MRTALTTCLALAVAAAGGCIPSRAMEEGQIDAYWYLDEDPWPKAQPKPLAIAGRTLPSRWVFRQEPNLIWSTVSIVRAVDRLEEGGQEFNVAVSPAHAEMLVTVLAEVRGTLAGLRAIADPSRKKTPEQWSAAVADALVSAEQVTRLVSPEEGRGDPLAMSAGPMLQVAAAYLNDHTGGSLLEGMGPQQIGQVRRMLVQVLMRLGFAAAGKQDPPALASRIAGMMREAQKPEQLHGALAEALAREVENAPPAGPDNRLPSLLRTGFYVATRFLEFLEMFLNQWDRLDSLVIEFRQLGDQSVVSVTLSVKPGRELKLAGLFFMQPALAFSGKTRITVQPKVAGTDETVVLFEPLEGGRAELRFEGILYGMVRLLALPLNNAAMREVRISLGSGPAGKMTSVALLMEARGRDDDPRRILTFQDVRAKSLRREAFRTRTVTGRTEQTFNYITPTRHYTYRRIKTPGD